MAEAARSIEATLEDTQARLAAALSSSDLGTWIWDLATDRVAIDAFVAQLFFVDADPAGVPIADLRAAIHPDDLHQVHGIIEQADRAGGRYQAEYRLIRRDGSIAWVDVRGTLERDADGRPHRMTGVVIDVSERRVAQEALRHSEERLRLALDAGQIGVWDWDIPHDRVEWSDWVYKSHGVVPGNFGGNVAAFAELIHPEDVDRVQGLIKRALETGEPYQVEFRVLSPDGAVRWLKTDGQTTFDAAGRPVRMIGATTDITAIHEARAERERLIAALDTERRRLESLVRISSRIAGAGLDLRTLATSIVGTVAEVMGEGSAIFLLAPDASTLELLALDHVDPMLAERFRALLTSRPLRIGEGIAGRTVAEGRAVRVSASSEAMQALEPVEHRSAYAGFPAINVLGVPLRAAGATIGALVTVRFGGDGRPYEELEESFIHDIADRASLAIENATLYQQARDAIQSRDQFMSIAAHELRTPVTGIKAYSQLLERRLSRGPVSEAQLLETMRSIGDASDRLARLTEDLLDVSRLQTGLLTLRLQAIDLVEVVDLATRRFVAQLDGRHEVDVAIREAHLPIQGDPERLEQVVWNLLSNAVKYSPEGGRVRIELQSEQNAACLSVEDSGIGLPPGAIETIFEPFGRAANATESSIAGLGLGLYITRSIVERHSGMIVAESDGHGLGSRFIVRLPVSPA